MYRSRWAHIVNIQLLTALLCCSVCLCAPSAPSSPTVKKAATFPLPSGVSYADYPILPFEKYQCGSGKGSREYAYNVTVESCSELTHELNHCCLVHDHCYNEAIYTQKECDDVFFQCNQRQVDRIDPERCTMTLQIPQAILPLVGFMAYNSNVIDYSAVGDEELELHFPHGSLKIAYEYMYADCRPVRDVVSSCGVLVSKCLAIYPDVWHSCVSELNGCLSDAALIHPNSTKCTIAIAAAKEHLSIVYNRMYMKEKQDMNTPLIVLAFVCLLSLVLLVLCTWRYYTLKCATNKYRTINSQASLMSNFKTSQSS